MIKLKRLITEDIIGTIYYNRKEYEIYKNPKSIKRMKAYIRAVTYPNGDLFVVDDSMDIIHSDLTDWLKKNGYPNPDNGTNRGLIKMIESGYITWQRVSKTNLFLLSESIDFNDILFMNNKERLMPYLEKYSKIAKQKNSQYDFVLKSIS